MNEQKFNLTTISDQTLRQPAMSVLGNPVRSWIMICHADEFWTIYPRRMAMENDQEEERNGRTSREKGPQHSKGPSLNSKPIRKQISPRGGKDDGRFSILAGRRLSYTGSFQHDAWSQVNIRLGHSSSGYMENRLVKWQDDMAWGTTNGLAVPEYIPLGQTIRYYRDAFYVHFKLHDFHPDAMKCKGAFNNSNLKTGTHDETAEFWLGSFLNVSSPEQVAQFPSRSVESVLLESCLDDGSTR